MRHRLVLIATSAAVVAGTILATTVPAGALWWR